MFTRFKGSKAFLEEINEWLEEKIIDENQAQILIDRYELDGDAPWYLRTSFMLRGLAIALVLGGFLLIISTNWNNLPFVARMLTGILPFLFTCYLSYKYIQEEDKDAAELSLFAASILFGINIFLQAQIFHISSYFPDGFLWWLIGALPVAVYMRSHLLGVVLQFIFIAWISLEVSNLHFNWLAPLLLGAFLYLMYLKANQVATVVHLFVIYFFYTYVSICIDYNWQAEPSRFIDQFYYFFHVPSLVSFGLFFMSLFLLIQQSYSEKFRSRVFGLISFVIAFCFYIFTFEYAISPRLLYGPFVLLALAVILIIYKKESLDFNLLLSLGAVLAIFLAKIILMLVYEGGRRDFWYDHPEYSFFILILMNALFLAFAIAKIYYGIQYRVKGQFMMGIFYVIALALARYVSLFGDYITTAIIFIACGVGIYFLNNLWNQRYAAQ